MTQDSIQINVPRSVLVAAFLDTPARGAPYLGGIYAGPTLDIGPMALILLPGEYTGAWEGARGWRTWYAGAVSASITP